MRILALTIIFLFHSQAYAQKQDNVWCMGHNGGIDFNTNPPTKFESEIYSIETVASISDRHTGALLFYTDGGNIWDAGHNIMQNGTGIGQDKAPYSSVQGAVIVPFINDENRYYVFTLPAMNPVAGQLFYSIVDMRLNNGLGGVDSSAKKVKTGEGFNEAMAAMQGCGIIWLVVQKRGTGDFYAYKISADGIAATPVISSPGYRQRPSSQAGIRASADYRKIASIGKYFDDLHKEPYIALQDFDAATGIISNGIVIDTGVSTMHYGCEFSPNGKFLYVTEGNKVYQYNISLSTAAAVAASKTAVGESSSSLLNNLQLRDDGNIYIAGYESNYLDRLSNCDAAAPGCVFTGKAVEIGGAATYNLPAKIVLPKTPVEGNNTKKDTTTCSGLPVILKSKSYNATWQDGSNSNVFSADGAGVYWVRGYNEDCKLSTDTFVVRDCHLYFPSAFSPNGDGRNDIARILGDVGALTDYSLNIYNRWGQLVFTGTNPHEGWNGMQGASLVDLGVYFYYIQYKYNGKKELMKGDIVLIR